tara:strand:+ start:560 stop:1297 length:738 start_codon:yes stop_codon:yes gene_type:complete
MISDVLRYFYIKLLNFKISKLHNTKNGKYYLPLFNNDLIAREIISNKIYQNEILNIAKEYITENSAIIDVGANFGQLSIEFSKLQKNTVVYSFEAQKFIYELLKKNVKVNNVNVKCFYNLIGDKNQTIRIKKDKLKKYKTWGSNHIELAEIDENSNLIEEKKIDDFNIIESISFMKIDVQGRDLFVLKGAKSTILKHKMPIIFEYEEEFENVFNFNFDDFVKFIKEINYKIHLKFENNYLILPIN